MARRSTVDRRPQSAEYRAGFPASGDLGPEGVTAPAQAPRHWRGAGGRWLVWMLRIIIWAVVLLIGYRGVTAIVGGETSPARPAPAVSHGTGFPVSLASAYALQFGQVYLTASPATAAHRAAALAAYLPRGTDTRLGWNGGGTLQLAGEHVAGVRVKDAHHAVVTLLAQVNGHLMELGVPIYAARGGIVVSGEPAWLPAPKRVSVPSSSVGTSDSVTQSDLMSQLPAFFQAYASGSSVTLGRFLAPGTRLRGLGGQLAFGSLNSVTVPAGGDTRHITATVTWWVPGQVPLGEPGAGSRGALQMSYALTVTKHSGSWYVRDISPSLQPIGQP